MPQPDHPRAKPPRNRKLEAARRALLSPSGAPGMCMSRQELAEAANTYVWEHTRGRQRTNMTEHDIGRYERGEVHSPGDWRRFGLRGVLGASSDLKLGFYLNRKTSTSSVITGSHRSEPPIPSTTRAATSSNEGLEFPADRHHAMETATGLRRVRLAPKPLVDAGDSGSAPAFPKLGATPANEDAADEIRELLASAAAVDASTIRLLAVQTNHIREIDRRLGAKVAETQLRGHLEALDQLLTFATPAGRRESLVDLYADAASLAGWQALDLGDLNTAWRFHETARRVGRENSKPAALSHAMAQQAYVLVELDEMASAVQLAEFARSAAGTIVSPLLRAWLWAVQGELHALSGDRIACFNAFDTAARLVPADAYDPDLPYIILGEPHLSRWRGNALAQLGDPAAIDDLQLALNGLDSSFTRARAGVHVDLAQALVTAGHPKEAAAELNRASVLAGRVGSARQRRRIHRLNSALQTI